MSSKVVKRGSEAPLVDLLGGASRWDLRLHEHGLISLLDVMPRLVPEGQTADAAIVQAARVSYGMGTKKSSDDRALIRYLLRHRHTTPFEMVEFKFHVVLPVFVARQWIRHRTASVNEYSARYSVVPDRFYHPSEDQVRAQSATNRQGSAGNVPEDVARLFTDYLRAAETGYGSYEQLLEKGIARELARVGLPQNVYTEWYWKCDLHNVMHFLELRLAESAQQEIREYAEAMYALVLPLVPMAMEAFQDYRLGAVTLTRHEIEAVRQETTPQFENKREEAEWQDKAKKLGFKNG